MAGFVGLFVLNGTVQASEQFVVTAVITLIRFGLLAMATWLVLMIPVSFPSALDMPAWYAGRTVVVLLFSVAVVCYGAWISMAGRPLLARDLIEDRVAH